ncbi:integration host factor subunit beta [Caedimonas varicaedens]|uniref:Integration host factor subunit beta n=1 Tax=Caedimonas varicaedens TaxID=1629334 RepID=A0A0K8MAV5_9PROT|nr:integration host factor subunit beta [Caedimonas varicaedens]
MNRAQLMASLRLAVGSEISDKQIETLVSLVLKKIVHTVDCDQRVEIRGFGVFCPRVRQSRLGRNPKTGESVSVSTKRILFFKAGKTLKDRLNGKQGERSSCLTP